MKELFNLYIDNNYIYERNIYYLIEYISTLSKLNLIDELKDIFNRFDKIYFDSISYIIHKARCAINNYYNNDMAIEIMENIDDRVLNVSGKERLRYYSLYLRLLANKKEHEKAIKIINVQSDSHVLMKLDAYMDNLFYYDKDKFLEKTMYDFENSDKNTEDYINYTYNLLKLEEYDEIYNIYQQLINDLSNRNVNKTNSVLKINYSLAKKLRKNASKIRENNLDDILNQSRDSLEKAAAYILLDDFQNANKIIRKEIDNDYMMYYRLQLMPVFKQINFNELKKESLTIN